MIEKSFAKQCTKCTDTVIGLSHAANSRWKEEKMESTYLSRSKEDLLNSIRILAEDSEIMNNSQMPHIAKQNQIIIDAILEELKSRTEGR